MEPLLSDPVYLLVFYAAVAVAMGPDILREIRRRREDTDTAEAHDEGSRRVIGVAGGGGIIAGVAAVYLLPSMAILLEPTSRVRRRDRRPARRRCHPTIRSTDIR